MASPAEIKASRVNVVLGSDTNTGHLSLKGVKSRKNLDSSNHGSSGVVQENSVTQSSHDLRYTLQEKKQNKKNQENYEGHSVHFTTSTWLYIYIYIYIYKLSK